MGPAMERAGPDVQAGREGAAGRLDPAALRRLHVCADAGLVSLAWLGAWATRSLLGLALGAPINPVGGYAAALPAIVAAWLASCFAFGIYQHSRFATAVDQIQRLGKGVLLGLLAISSLGFFAKEWDFGRAVVLLTGAYALALQGASRAAFFRLERSLRGSGRFDVRALILGAGTTGIRLLQKLQDHPEIGYRVVGILDDDPALASGKVGGCPVLGRLDALRAVVAEHAVQEVFVAAPGMGHTRMLSGVLECEDLDVTFRVVTNLFEVLTAGAPVDLVDDLPLVQLGGRRPSPLYAPAKRALDVAGALLLGSLVAPFAAWWALRIRLDSPGPVLFAQERVGLGGRRFRLRKLRTLHADAAPYAVAPRSGEDPRITRYGRWLRRTSIDELPQLWNVLRGDMSLVGPRPEMPFIVETYDEWQRRRLSVKPGITGLWQILGRKDLPMHDNLQYDFYYIRNRSLAMDLSLLVRTVAVVLSRRGAY
jgi:exopolysaccharide biosynthesis polyprenyl glycosylphosphotransferase